MSNLKTAAFSFLSISLLSAPIYGTEEKKEFKLTENEKWIIKGIEKEIQDMDSKLKTEIKIKTKEKRSYKTRTVYESKRTMENDCFFKGNLFFKESQSIINSFDKVLKNTAKEVSIEKNKRNPDFGEINKLCDVLLKNKALNDAVNCLKSAKEQKDKVVFCDALANYCFLLGDIYQKKAKIYELKDDQSKKNKYLKLALTEFKQAKNQFIQNKDLKNKINQKIEKIEKGLKKN